ncbi:tetratricopeptide repeat protein [Arsukibacterium sp.]|uniref:tetratricopeptide repeat protein n=1 Tax=Arsukibacterium sp. TaxID=1977258 RepID=UPI002FD9C2C0
MTFSAKKFATAVALSVLASSPFLASAASNGYKMVLIEDTPGADTIQAGELEQGIKEVTTSLSLDADGFSRSMALCVAYSRLGQLAQAEASCNSAVNQARTYASAPRAIKREMRALAFSNRGVMHLLAGNRVAALEDFKQAVSIDKNDISVANLERLTASINGVALQQYAFHAE